jgi:protein translocase SecG subunit
MTLLAQAPGAAAPAAAPSAAPAAAAAVAAGMSVGQYAFGFLYMVVALLLIMAILSRTTQAEGLGGSMMGGSDTNFRGAKSTEDTIDQITNAVAIVFVVLSIAANYVY